MSQICEKWHVGILRQHLLIMYMYRNHNVYITPAVALANMQYISLFSSDIRVKICRENLYVLMYIIYTLISGTVTKVAC